MGNTNTYTEYLKEGFHRLRDPAPLQGRVHATYIGKAFLRELEGPARFTIQRIENLFKIPILELF